MKPLIHFLLSADASLEDKIFIGKKELFLDKDFNKYGNTVQFGYVTHLPINYEGVVRVGDKAYVHHHIVQPDNFVLVDGEKRYKCLQDNLFCVVRGEELIPTNLSVFCTEVFEPEENCITKSGIYLKSAPDRIKQTVKIIALSEHAKTQGLSVGDEVVHVKGVDYKFKAEGKEFVKLDTKYILGKRIGKTFKPLAII